MFTFLRWFLKPGQAGRRPPEKWRTVAVYREDHKFLDTKKPYSFTFTLKVGSNGNRKIEENALPSDSDAHILKHIRQSTLYCAYLNPWVEGTLTLEELAGSVKGLTIIPVQTQIL